MPKRKPTRPKSLEDLKEEHALQRQRARRAAREKEREERWREESAGQLIRAILGDELFADLPPHYDSTDIIEELQAEEEIELEIYQASERIYSRIVRWMADFGMRMVTPREEWLRHAVGHMHARFSGPPGTMERLCSHRWFALYVFSAECRKREHPNMASMMIAETRRRGGSCTCKKCNIHRREAGLAPLYEADGSQAPDNY